MKLILVPTDFSDCAEKALHVAMVIARQQQARILLFHTIEKGVAMNESAMPLSNKWEERKTAEGRLLQLGTQIDYAGGLSYEYQVGEGRVVDSILKYSKERKATFIIMGTKGQNGLDDIVFGTITSEVIAAASCPVIAVPESTVLSRPLRRITYATSYVKTDLPALRSLVELARPMNAAITVLHVAEPEETHEIKKFGEFIQTLESSMNYAHISFQLLNADDVESALRDYIATGATDMLVVSTRYRGFFGRLLGSSITADLAQTTNIPIIAFHHGEHLPPKVF